METKSTVGISPDFRYVLRVLALLATRDGIPLDRVIEAYGDTYRELVESGELSKVATVREYAPGDLEFQNFSIVEIGAVIHRLSKVKWAVIARKIGHGRI